MEEYDPYAQHNEVPAIGYIDPPAEPYRYISPVKREIRPKSVAAASSQEHATSKPESSALSSVNEAPLCSKCGAAGTSASPKDICSLARIGITVGVQTTLTGSDIDRMVQQAVEAQFHPTISSSRASSTGGAAKRVSASAITRRPAEPLRSSSSKKVPVAVNATTIPVATTRSKSNSKNAEIVVAAPRSSRVGVPAGSPSAKSLSSESAGTPNTPTGVSISVNARGGAQLQQQRLLDVTPAAVRKMFSGSGNNGVGASARTHSANKMRASVSASPSSAPLVPNTTNTSLKRGKSSDRQGPSVAMIGLGGGSAGAALQAALARSMVRKQATAASQKVSDHQNVKPASTKPEVGSPQVDGSPIKKGSGIASLSTPTGGLLRAGGSARAPSSSPSSSALSSLNPPPPPAKFSRGPSTGSQGSPAVNVTVATSVMTSQRRPIGAAPVGTVLTQPPTVVSAKRTNVAGSAPSPPTRTASSKVVARKPSTGVGSSPSTSHVDPVSNGLVLSPTLEIKKAQGINQQIIHAQASLDSREKARTWQQKADEKATT